MIFAAHQPNLLPYLGWWAKLEESDRFGLMAGAQFSKGDYHNRVRIGWDDSPRWLTVPVKVTLGERIDEVEIAEHYQASSLLAILDATYARYASWANYRDDIQDMLEEYEPGSRLIGLSRHLIGWLRTKLEAKTEIVEMPMTNEDPSERLARWTEETGCNVYLSGRGGRSYLDEAPFHRRGLEVRYQEAHMQYGYQKVSALTALIDHGVDWRKVLA